MRVSAISTYNRPNYAQKRNAKINQNSHEKFLTADRGGNTVTFNGKVGKILGGLLGGAAGGAAGGAIIGGGTLAGMAALAALGPVGIALAAAYTVGGALAGGYVGSGIADAIEDKNNPKKNP